jgi:hypothetical protein
MALLLACASCADAAFTCSPSNDAVQCAALGDFFASTNGSGWTKNGNWTTAQNGAATDFCTFGGVMCSSTLVSGMCALSIFICPHIWALTSLTSLNFLLYAAPLYPTT